MATWLSLCHTLAKHRPTLPVVALDAIRDDLDIEATDNQGEVIQKAREACANIYALARDFAFHATNVTHQMPKRWIDLFTDYDARIEFCLMSRSKHYFNNTSAICTALSAAPLR